mgnify:CR=1 FL=1
MWSLRPTKPTRLSNNNAANIHYIEDFGLIENVADAFLKKFAFDNCLREHQGAG